MRYAKQKAASQRVQGRNRNIWLYSLEHEESSQEDIGRVFHLSGQMVGKILKVEARKQAELKGEG